jgi:hypothetical protein
VGEKTIQRTAGDPMPERVPIIRVDLLLRITAPKRGEIEAANVRGIYYQLAQLGMHFKSITYDSFGSLESIQILKRDGYNADEYSLDKTPEGYNILRQSIYDECILCYMAPRLQQELLTVEFDEKKQKVDHPPHGSKDLADALAGAVAAATKWFCEQIAPQSMLPVAPKVTEDKLIPGTMDLREYDDPWEKIEQGLPITDDDWTRLR